MTIEQAFDKYKHIDAALSDADLTTTFMGTVAHDLWLAIKEELEK